MSFQTGDPVVHWTYGLGEVLRLEERDLSGQKRLYYEVKIEDMTIWVPADGNLGRRLRTPSSKKKFQELYAILSSQGESLPEDRLERHTILIERLSEGSAESLCRLIRDLTTRRLIKPLNESDNMVLKRAQKAILTEWGFSMSISPAQAEKELQRLLGTTAVR